MRKLNGNRVPDAAAGQIKSLYIAGLSNAQIADRLGISRRAVQRRTRDIERPGERRRHGNLTRDDIADLRAAYVECRGDVQKTARQCGVSVKTVYTHTRDMRALSPCGGQKPKAVPARRWLYHGSPIELPYGRCAGCRWRMNKSPHTVCGVCYKEIIDGGV